jgi:hypothetical protein
VAFWGRRRQAENRTEPGHTFVVALDHETVLSGNASRVAAWLYANLMSTPQQLVENCERIDFSWSGLGSDPRDLWEVPDVVGFVEDLDRR